MTAASTNPFNRADTLLGVCQAIGEDFGFHPNFLRIGFAVALFWSAAWVFVAYLALGVLVLASRLLFPARTKTAEAAPMESTADNDADTVELARAA